MFRISKNLSRLFLYTKRPYYNFISEINNKNNNDTHPLIKSMEELKSMPKFDLAMREASSKKYELAIDNLESVLQELQTKEDLDPSIYLLVLKRYSLLLVLLEKNEKLANSLEEMFFINFSNNSWNSPAFLPTARNLFINYSLHDLKKGKALIDIILEENSKNPFPEILLKDLYLDFGNIETLYGQNYYKAFEYYNEFDKIKEINSLKKAISLNNLGFCNFWNYIDKLKSLKLKLNDLNKSNNNINDEKLYCERKDLQEEIDKMESGYINICENVLINLKKALLKLEFEDELRAKDQLTKDQFVTIKVMLDEKNIYPNLKNILLENFVLKNQISPKIAMNIGELYFRIGNIELATFWLETSLDNAIKSKNFHSVLRGMVLLANIYQLDSSKKEFVENVFKDCLEHSHRINSYNLTFCLENYAFFLKGLSRNYEADDYLAQVENLKKKGNKWDEKIDNLIIFEYDLLF